MERSCLKNSQHTVNFYKNLAKITNEIDLCILTTTSDIRLSVVERVLSGSGVRYWVLEKVLDQSLEQINRSEKLLSNADGVWINTPRRAYS